MSTHVFLKHVQSINIVLCSNNRIPSPVSGDCCSVVAVIVAVLQFAGPTALHLAVRCGSVDAVACLLAHCANILLTDEQGWAAVHHAAYFDQHHVLRMLVRRNPSVVELPTTNECVPPLPSVCLSVALLLLIAAFVTQRLFLYLCVTK